MQVPLSWLKNYVPVSLSPKELAHRLTMAGTEISGVQDIGGNWDRDKILIGRVLKVDRHPNADRLTLPTVDLGNGETATVVCGAPNVGEGQRVAFAKEGARLVNARSGKVEELKAAKIRGVISAGMVCSERELGLGEDHEGILVLDEGAPVGMPLTDYMGDVVLDAEVTPNRPDCLSVLGIAHEVAALTGEKVTEPDLAYPVEGEPIEEQVKIEIADPHLCPRYTASLVTGLTIGPSPQWLKDVLVRAGQRPINNVVDITNYAMLEYGQPIHAFDLDTIRDRTIIVRAARPGEKLVTLDNETRTLDPPMLAIADSRNAIALAGVMGGADTGIQDTTTSVLLESANFDSINTRRTGSALRLSTEASYRFERGIRADLAPLALRRATQLILQIAGGKAAKGIVDLYPGQKAPPMIKATRGRINKVLGADLGMGQIERILTSLGFQPSGEPGAKDELSVIAPYWRSDIALQEDLVEEVARIVGYDNVPTTMLSTPVPHHEPQPLRELRERIRDTLAASGMQEVISYSLTDRKLLDGVEALADGTEPLKIANPMSSEMQYLRTSLRGSILKTLDANRRNLQGEGMRLFEIGRVYLPKEEAKEKDLPTEKEIVVGVFSGPRFPISWLAPQKNMDLFDAKGVLESVSRQINARIEYEPSTDPILHHGKTARLLCEDIVVGVVGEVHLRVLERFNLGADPVSMFEIDLEPLHDAMPRTGARYAGISRFPESERDIALVVDHQVPSARIQSIIESHKLVARSSPFDLYTGHGIPEGKNSIAYRVVFQSPTGTLTAEEIDRAERDILRKLTREVGAQLRE